MIEFQEWFEEIMNSPWMWFVMGWVAKDLFYDFFRKISKPDKPKDSETGEYDWHKDKKI